MAAPASFLGFPLGLGWQAPSTRARVVCAAYTLPQIVILWDAPVVRRTSFGYKITMSGVIGWASDAGFSGCSYLVTISTSPPLEKVAISIGIGAAYCYLRSTKVAV